MSAYKINLLRFEKFVARQTIVPNAKYRYTDAAACPLARFITEVVKPRKPKDWCTDWPFVVVSATAVHLGDFTGALDPDLNAVVRNEPHTYKDLLTRVRRLIGRRKNKS